MQLQDLFDTWLKGACGDMSLRLEVQSCWDASAHLLIGIGLTGHQPAACMTAIKHLKHARNATWQNSKMAFEFYTTLGTAWACIAICAPSFHSINHRQ